MEGGVTQRFGGYGRPIIFAVSWLLTLLTFLPGLALAAADSVPGSWVRYLIDLIASAIGILLVVRSLRSGLYLSGDQLKVRKVTYSRSLAVADVRRLVVSDSWILPGGQCIGVELRHGRTIKCPAATPGGFGAERYEALRRALGLAERDDFVERMVEE
jgi:hypothetical protein